MTYEDTMIVVAQWAAVICGLVGIVGGWMYLLDVRRQSRGNESSE